MKAHRVCLRKVGSFKQVYIEANFKSVYFVGLFEACSIEGND